MRDLWPGPSWCGSAHGCLDLGSTLSGTAPTSGFVRSGGAAWDQSMMIAPQPQPSLSPLTEVVFFRSALMHLLPGLAVHCNRYYLGPKGAPAVYSSVKALVDGSDPKASWTRLQISNMGLGWQWHFLYPLLFYCLWQLGYFLVVQVCLGSMHVCTSYVSGCSNAGCGLFSTICSANHLGVAAQSKCCLQRPVT